LLLHISRAVPAVVHHSRTALYLSNVTCPAAIALRHSYRSRP